MAEEKRRRKPKAEEAEQQEKAAEAKEEVASEEAEQEKPKRPRRRKKAEPEEAPKAEEKDEAEEAKEEAAEEEVAAEEGEVEGEPPPEDEEGRPEEAAEETPSARGGAAAAGRRAATPAPRTEDGALAVRAQAKYVRCAPRKARLVIDHIRGKSVDEARAILLTTPRAASRDILKLLDSAVANAENNHELVADELRIGKAFVDEGPTLKRYRPRALGRATRIRKRTSHMTITLTAKD